MTVKLNQGGAIALAFLAGFSAQTLAREPLAKFTPLLSTSKTIVDEPIAYPVGAPAKLTASILALAPGDETGWHTHGVPLAGIVLEGEMTVDYGDRGKKVFRKGDAVAEAISIPHNGINTGTEPVRVFVLFMGAEGLPTAIPLRK
jgi:quercetin dioxygenase-like cupin family protein